MKPAVQPDQQQLHSSFLASSKPHILMPTNHGIHQWEVVPGLQDTGGQNLFVNQFAEVLARRGFRITITNRGGYRHPVSGSWQRGISYRHENLRLIYIEDGKKEFIRKEDMHEQIADLVQALKRRIDCEGLPIDLIISHYWDAAVIADQFAAQNNREQKRRIRHIWVPHSLGIMKKGNVDPEQWQNLRIDERIATEKNLIGRLDGIAATSSRIAACLRNDYHYGGPEIFLPPCIDVKRYYPHRVEPDEEILKLISRQTGIALQDLDRYRIISEISRTDTTKRKDILIRAFAEVHRKIPHSILVISIDDARKKLAQELKALISSLDLGNCTVVVGSIWEMLPSLYAATDVYCTPAAQEGFGMSAQEAAATSVPVVASDRVPFTRECLLGPDPEELGSGPSSEPILRGNGAIQVKAGNAQGFARALELLLSNERLRQEMGRNAYRATIPYFTWDSMVERFLAKIEFTR